MLGQGMELSADKYVQMLPAGLPKREGHRVAWLPCNFIGKIGVYCRIHILFFRFHSFGAESTPDRSE